MTQNSASVWEIWVKHLFGGFAALLLFFMMSLTFVDVILRYWFNAPVPGGFEVTELLLATLIFCGLPMVTIDEEHISVDLFDRLVPTAIRWIRDLLVLLTCNICIAVLAWRMWHKAMESVDYGDITSVLELPLAPVFFIGSVALAMTTVVFLVLFIKAIRQTVPAGR